MELYSIARTDYTSDKKYIFHCDEHWYETTNNEIPRFTEDEVIRIAKQMQRHYVPQYRLRIANFSGTEYVIHNDKLSPLTKPNSQRKTKGIGLFMRL
jgi:hypothetical protein